MAKDKLGKGISLAEWKYNVESSEVIGVEPGEYQVFVVVGLAGATTGKYLMGSVKIDPQETRAAFKRKLEDRENIDEGWAHFDLQQELHWTTRKMEELEWVLEGRTKVYKFKVRLDAGNAVVSCSKPEEKK